MRFHHLVICFLLSGSIATSNCKPNLSAQEFAVVTSEQGYVVNEQDEIEYKLPYFSMVEFSDVKDNKLILSHGGGKRGIRLGQVFAILELSKQNVNRPLNANNQQVMKDALIAMRDAFKLSSQEKHAEAIKKGKDATSTLGLLFFADPAPSPFQVWFESHIAYFEYAAGKLDAANNRLKIAESMLGRITPKDPVQAADLYNVRGLVLLSEGKPKEAIKQFERALTVAEKLFGKNHINRSAYFFNISNAQEQLGQIQKARESQNEAMKLMLDLLPKQAVEIPIAYSRLGDLSLAMGKPQQAMRAYEYSLRDFMDHHIKEYPNHTANARIGMYDAMVAMKNYEFAKIALDTGMRVELAAMSGRDAVSFRKAFLFRYGLLYYEQDKLDESLPYFEKAQKLYDRKHEESIDATVIATIGHVHAYNNENEQAQKAYRRAIEIYTRTEGKDSVSVAEVKQWLADLK